MDHDRTAQDEATLRVVHISWNSGLVAASMAISLLGAFTSTQLMCQARVSRSLMAVITWTAMASLTFGFCSIWSLHMVAMLACELDLPVGLDVTMTSISAVLAVTFTFLAFSEVIWQSYQHSRRRRDRKRAAYGEASPQSTRSSSVSRLSEEHLLQERASYTEPSADMTADPIMPPVIEATDTWRPRQPLLKTRTGLNFEIPGATSQAVAISDFDVRSSIESERGESDAFLRPGTPTSQRASSFSDSENAFDGLGRSVGLKKDIRALNSNNNPFTAIALAIWAGLSYKNVSKGFIWSLAITCMHYLGIFSLKIPGGSVHLNFSLVVLSALISWLVCSLGCILMPSIEINMSQQLLFSAVASSGVAAMHYTGMAALQLYSTSPPLDRRGYPSELPIAIASIAIVTCLAANALLAHSATLARNKLAEIVRTRRKLWAAIAQKEMAEAAALARSEFIASASHEIRTPLHQLQGYSDLLARCSLPQDAEILLFAIQDATKALSLITNNVLDWSRLEKGEASTRPIDLDVRQTCDSMVKFLSRRDEDLDVELIAVVTPCVPQTILIDETYLQRIIMNLVSNALKFTTSGYVLLQLTLEDRKLIITVEDTGIGIPKSFLPHLFEPFKQAQIRGAERGTGLGLSIVKQLLEKLHGSITVQSIHTTCGGDSAARCGSKFTVDMPIDTSLVDMYTPTVHPGDLSGKKLAYIGPYSRILTGLQKAWKPFLISVEHMASVQDITHELDYIWVDARTLSRDKALLQHLLDLNGPKVLLPFDDERALDDVLTYPLPHHFVLLRKPCVLHQIIESIARVEAGQNGVHSQFGQVSSRTVRFASTPMGSASSHKGKHTDQPLDDSEAQLSPLTSVKPANSISAMHVSSDSSMSNNNSKPRITETATTASVAVETVTAPITVLLVEDNKINQKLGMKMLESLSYKVVIASDGQEAVDLLVDAPSTAAQIDIILMDQSMPRKDGLTATKEIREFEASGKIVSALKWRHHSIRKNKRPILAVTAVVGPSQEAMCEAVGTDAFMPKPLSLKKLKDQLARYVEEMNTDSIISTTVQTTASTSTTLIEGL